MMLRRPKPTDSESDLLREQEQFLSSGTQSAVNIVRRPDKRRGDIASDDSEKSLGNQRDVVTIPDFPDQLPTLTPAPPKKSRFKKERVCFEDEDPEELLDRHDTHISAVLSRIIERDTSAVPVSFPAFTGTAFPKVLHRSTIQTQVMAPRGKKSIFASQIAAQNAKVRGAESQKDPLVSTPQASGSSHIVLGRCLSTVDGPLLLSGEGLGPDKAEQTLKIHQENQTRLQGMSHSEILEEQKLLLAQLDPRLVDFVRSRKSQKALSPVSPPPQREVCPDQPESKTVQPQCAKPQLDSEVVLMMGDEEDETKPAVHPAITSEPCLLPVKPQKEWLHMDKLEPEKLEWMKDLPAPRRQGTKKAMQARFDFSGTLIPPAEDLPVHLGLHHHGDEPELAGYSLQEIFLLSRSKLTQQRSLALNTLAHILSKAHAGEYSTCLSGSVLASLLDAGLLFLLRFSLDDSVESVMSAAVRALRALLVSHEDEECLDATFHWLLGTAVFPLIPPVHEEEDEEDEEGLAKSKKEMTKEREERKLDHDVARQDIVKALLKMQLLQRLRYILEVVRPVPRTVLDVLEILIRIARHSTFAATQILDCPRLMETVIYEFLPCTWTPTSSPYPPSLYGLPVSTVMKLLRVLSSTGRHVCARILNSLGGRRCLSRFLAMEPSVLLLEPGEAICCSTEALRLWAVSASYGQASKLYIDLYPVLVKTLQAAQKPCGPSEPLQLLELQRITALLSLLTQVTHTAGCHEELQSGTENLPPPPVTWGHVTGLQPTVTGLLKGCMRALDDPGQRSSALTLLPCYLVCMGAYYSQLSVQVSLDERVCSYYCRSSSIICQPVLRAPSPVAVPSLPSLGCCRAQSARGLVASESPLPLFTALFYLLDNLTSIHRGLAKNVGLNRNSLLVRFILFLITAVTTPAVPSNPSSAVPLHFMVSPWCEYLVHKLLRALPSVFLREGATGGPEAATLAELQLQEKFTPLTGLGALLRDALSHLPSIRGCYLTHLAHMEQAVLSSADRHLGRNPWLTSQLLPELTGPSMPSDWPFLPLVSLYEQAGVRQGGGLQVVALPAGALQSVVYCLQWLLLLESWREQALKTVPAGAKLARLACIFLCSSDLFLEQPVQELTWALLRGLTQSGRLEAIDLGTPPPGLASFHDLYVALLAQYEAVSFGDALFGCFLLLPLQRCFSATMRLALFGEHVGILRSLCVSLEQLPVPLESFTNPPEDSLPLLGLYFRSLVTGALRSDRCPVLYSVAIAHLNAFVFSQDAVSQEVEATRRSLLRKTYYLTDEVHPCRLLLLYVL
uniref:RNA polymerase II associated protein 1 n=1 Tax=Electrophorus electricus TaxID=8005 RepID=A0A4W4GHQ7_ELEEL